LESNSRFGQGFKLDILSDINQRSKAQNFIIQLIPGAKLVTANNAYLSYQIPKSVKLSTLFTKIETQRTQHGIMSWGISQSNLEEVFLTIVKQDEITTGAVDKKDGAQENATE